MSDLRIEQGALSNFLAFGVSKRNLGANYKYFLADELKSEKTFEEMFSETLQKYFGQSSQNFYHVTDATSISGEIWSHNDFPTEKFLRACVDESVLTWKPTRNNPAQTDLDVQSKLTATLGKNAVVIPPELEEKLKTDVQLREKVIGNLEKIFSWHMKPPAFKMPGVKEYGTKIYGSVTILNAQGEVEHCRITSGGTITGPDEETLRQIESERQKKLKRKEFNAELSEKARTEYIMSRNLLKML